MSVAKVIEISSASGTSIEDAVKSGLKKVSETVKGIQGAWVNEVKVQTDDQGNVVEWRGNPRGAFLLP